VRSARRFLRQLSPWAMVAGLVVVSTGLRAWAGLTVPVPWIAPDEMIYGLIGQSLYHSGTLDILGGQTPYYTLVVPAFVGLPLSLANLELGYGVLKVLQALAMSLTAVPVYLWGRSLVVDRRWAVAAAALTLAIPGLVYSGLVMTEVLFYPVLVLAAWATARTLEQPTLARQAVLVAAVTLAALTRLQALVLIPAVLTAVGADALLARSSRTLRRLAPTLVLVAVLAAVWVGLRAAGASVELGGYSVVSHSSYSAGRAVRFVLYHAADAEILSGVLPACALLLLLFAAARRGEPNRARRAYLAVAASFSIWFVVEVGVFASRYVGQLAERDLIYLAPVLFLGFALWLDGGAARSYWSMSIAGLLVALPIVFLPLDRLVTASAPPDAPTVAALYDLRNATSLGVLETVFYVGVAVAIVAFALVPRRAAWILPLALLIALASASVAAARYATRQGHALQRTYLGADRRWVDHAADGQVTLLFDPRASWVRVWETLFWNRRVEAVDTLAPARVFGPVPQTTVRIEGDGRLVAANRTASRRDSPYVAAPLGDVASVPAYTFVGRQTAYVPQPGSQTGGWALWKVEPPLRLSSRVTGLQANGDIFAGGDGHLVAYGCKGGVFQLTLLVKQPQTITILRNRTVYRHLRYPVPGAFRGTIRAVPLPAARPGTSECTLDVIPGALLGTTVFQFAR
jgi:Dolichyl-phosphate-mannose-protein mannosyltransferase